MIHRAIRSPLRPTLASPFLRAILAGGGGAAPASVSISPFGRINGAALANSGTKRVLVSRSKQVIGADCDSIRPLLMGWYYTASAIADGTSHTLEAYVEANGQIVQVTFSGSASRTVAGADTALADPLSASSFGLSQFSRDSVVWVQAKQTLAATGSIPIITSGGANFPAQTGENAVLLDPATATITFGTAGALVVGGTGATSGQVRPGMFLIATPKTAQRVIAAAGTSIVAGAGDGAALNGVSPGRGFFTRSNFTDPIALTGATPALNLGCFGGTANIFTGVNSARVVALLQYANAGLEEFGTNGTAMGSQQTATLAIWAAMRAAGYTTIIRTRLLSSTTSTDLYLTTANQTYASAAWTPPAGDKPTFDAWALGKLGAADGPTHYIDFPAVHDATLNYKWAVDGVTTRLMTSDGLHPSPNAAALMAADMRSLYATL